MLSKTSLVAALVLPLALLACDRADQSPTASGTSQEKQARTPSQDRMLESAPPAAGVPPATPAPSTEPGSNAATPANPAPSGSPSSDNR